MPTPPDPALVIRVHEIRGRSVHANRDFSAGDLVEECPVILIPPADEAAIEKTVLDHYWYNWDNSSSALVLGYGSLYNHSFQPNAVYVRDLEKQVMRFVAIRAIRRGEEILINYNGDPGSQEPISWFRVHESS